MSPVKRELTVRSSGNFWAKCPTLLATILKKKIEKREAVWQTHNPFWVFCFGRCPNKLLTLWCGHCPHSAFKCNIYTFMGAGREVQVGALPCRHRKRSRKILRIDIFIIKRFICTTLKVIMHSLKVLLLEPMYTWPYHLFLIGIITFTMVSPFSISSISQFINCLNFLIV